MIKLQPPTTVGSGGGAALPAGVIVAFAGAVVPVGWLLCDGSSVLVATYPALFAALGYVWGGAGVNFTLPTTMGLALVGASVAHPLGSIGNPIATGMSGNDTPLGITSGNDGNAALSGSVTISDGSVTQIGTAVQMIIKT